MQRPCVPTNAHCPWPRAQTRRFTAAGTCRDPLCGLPRSARARRCRESRFLRDPRPTRSTPDRGSPRDLRLGSRGEADPAPDGACRGPPATKLPATCTAQERVALRSRNAAADDRPSVHQKVMSLRHHCRSRHSCGDLARIPRAQLLGVRTHLAPERKVTHPRRHGRQGTQRGNLPLDISLCLASRRRQDFLHVLGCQVRREHPDRRQRYDTFCQLVEDHRKPSRTPRRFNPSVGGMLGQTQHLRAVGEQGRAALASTQLPSVKFCEERDEVSGRRPFLRRCLGNRSQDFSIP